MRVRNPGCRRIAEPDQANLGLEHGRHVVARELETKSHVSADWQIADPGESLWHRNASKIGETEK